MRFPITLTVLLSAVVSVVSAQSGSDASLADVARQSKAQKSTVKHVYDDQNSDFGRSTGDSGTPCGAPIASLDNGFVSTLVGKPVNDPDLAKALSRWLEKHPDLDVMHPEDVAKISFPNNSDQAKQNNSIAHAAAQHWLEESADMVRAGGDPNAVLSQIVGNPLKSNAESMLAHAVIAEKQRRIRSDASDADKLEEAVNLYSICESRKQAQFEPEVDRLAKQEFQKLVTQLAAGNAPAKQNPNEPTKGM